VESNASIWVSLLSNGKVAVNITDSSPVGVSGYTVIWVQKTSGGGDYDTAPSAPQWDDIQTSAPGNTYRTGSIDNVIEVTLGTYGETVTKRYWFAVIPVPDTGYALGDITWSNFPGEILFS